MEEGLKIEVNGLRYVLIYDVAKAVDELGVFFAEGKRRVWRGNQDSRDGVI